MKAVIIMVLIVWFVSAIVRAKQQQRMERIEAEQRRAKQVQIAQAKEQARQAKEIEKHETWLKKHDAEIEKLNRQVMTAQHDIKAAQDDLHYLYGLLDAAELKQMNAVPGSKADEAATQKVRSLVKQINAAEKREAIAKDKLSSAQRKLREVA